MLCFMKIGWVLRKCDKFVLYEYGMKFREPYHSNRVIPHRDISDAQCYVNTGNSGNSLSYL